MTVFVILHYLMLGQTEDCVASIMQKAGAGSFKIIIVDNGSPDDSGRVLQEKYRENQKIEVICNGDNLGFAKGNNIGIQRARKIGADFVICLNNDTRLVTPNFLKQVENVYQRTQAGVIGPMVLQGDGKFTGNPLLLKPRTLRDVDNILTENKRRLFGLTHGLFGQIFLKLYDTRRQRLNRKRGDSATEQEKALVSLKEQMNIILHGCFWR